MIRKMLVGIGLVGLLAAGVSTPAEATPVVGAAVFVGNATVGSGAYTGAAGNGLCLPPQVNLGGCVQSAGNQGWSFTAGGTNCLTVGVYGSSGPYAGTCELDFDGTVYANPAGLGPSCGVSGGDSAAGTAADRFGPTGDTKPGSVAWTTSATGTLVVHGSLTDPATGTKPGPHGHGFNGVVQARPLTPGACVSAPATDFTIAGVVVAVAP